MLAIGIYAAKLNIRPVSRDDLFGDYSRGVFEPYGNEAQKNKSLLYLHNDGSYSCKHIYKDSTISCKGFWYFFSERYITLYSYILSDEIDKSDSSKSMMPLKIEKHYGEITLGDDLPELPPPYVKQDYFDTFDFLADSLFILWGLCLLSAYFILILMKRNNNLFLVLLGVILLLWGLGDLFLFYNKVM